MTARHERILPVVIGGDIGVYAIARQLHEATGQRVTVLANAPIDAIRRSTYIDIEPLPAHAARDEIRDALNGLAAGREPRSAVVMANTDAMATILASLRSDLEPVYAVPFPDVDVIDRVSDKGAFGRICDGAGVRSPRQVVVDFSGADDPDWAAPAIDIPFPLVAKAAVGAAYDAVEFPGKRKIWFVDSAAELDSLWAGLREAGFRSTFVVQELIAGDNTAMRSITAYVGSDGAVRLIGSARVLLEDHAPTMIGNPVAMITEAFPELWAGAERILTAAGYRGFANFDVKIDPATGEPVFFEINPRIGRNSFYMTAAGANPMVPMLADLIDGEPLPRKEVTTEILYSLVPTRLLLRYIRDDALAARIRSLAPGTDPLRDPADRSLVRAALVEAQRLNHYRKFKRYYPKPTDLSY
ncbi:carboxylate--amine ligase [Actinomyces gaoshouyii]|uniref:carboxylate--amine ligase n=1 Tax=Actinomyces gaoshouyii TaxID=1960083 RepID=UPI0009BDB55B|nr:carboxylate--amine ligase [Actinomyces gaoshouyii]ARD41617.1 carboxylate--amine ligase [Actinomyces gaoshouyii]